MSPAVFCGGMDMSQELLFLESEVGSFPKFLEWPVVIVLSAGETVVGYKLEDTR